MTEIKAIEKVVKKMLSLGGPTLKKLVGYFFNPSF
jgi:hypothetical protein